MFQTQGWQVVKKNLEELESDSLELLRTADLPQVGYYQGNLRVIRDLFRQLNTVKKYEETEDFEMYSKIIEDFEKLNGMEE